mmetsp:Transcript_11219/g.32276  ORF Transcript_11219/g.32276 Transcript_11219/m.32276 type:complete len:120 (+) Transcript_11219:71-430(+)
MIMRTTHINGNRMNLKNRSGMMSNNQKKPSVGTLVVALWTVWWAVTLSIYATLELPIKDESFTSNFSRIARTNTRSVVLNDNNAAAGRVAHAVVVGGEDGDRSKASSTHDSNSNFESHH